MVNVLRTFLTEITLYFFSNYSQWLSHKSTFGPKAYRTTLCVLRRNEHIKKKKYIEVKFYCFYLFF